jgi:serine/threonine protein phosphatase PrpC
MTALFALAAAAASGTGLARLGNQDAAYAGRSLFAVADGLGGHAAGEEASAAVIQVLRSHDAEVAPGVMLTVLSRAVAEANREVARRADGNLARRGMGTTLTAMFVSGDRAALAHIGDSRALLLRDGRLRQITEDHTIGNLVWNAGVVAPVLARYLDGEPDRSADLGLRDLRAGDRYLLCTGGLSPAADDRTLRDVLTSADRPARAARQLAALAQDGGRADNFTVVVIDVHAASDGLAPAEPVTPGVAAPGAAVR